MDQNRLVIENGQHATIEGAVDSWCRKCDSIGYGIILSLGKRNDVIGINNRYGR